MNPKKIVAFLQNPWFLPGTNPMTILRYTESAEFRRRVLINSMTGRRLSQAFMDAYEEIHWDNANPLPVYHSSGAHLPDLEHMMRVIRSQHPEIILTFGRVAQGGIMSLSGQVNLSRCFHCHHPNARFKTQEQLNAFANIVLTLPEYPGTEGILCQTPQVLNVTG